MKKFWHNSHGNFAVMLAVAAAPILGAVGLAVDYATIHNKRSELQQIADSAALAATRELSLSKLSNSEVQSIADSYALANFATGHSESLKVDAKTSDDGSSVTVKLAFTWQPMFAHFLDQKALPLVAASTATFSGEQASVCVLALDRNSDKAIDMGNEATVTANGCSIFSNSKSSKGITIFHKSKIAAQDIFSAGGFDGRDSSFKPLPITDSPVVADPLANRAAPTFSGCDYNGFTFDRGVQTLEPGVYCGGLDVGGFGVANLKPGNYIIKDGPLSIRGNASINAENVGFYFTGLAATFDFGVNTKISISAPKSGPLSGILFFEDRDSASERNFAIRSRNAEMIEGTVYLPKGRLWIDKESRVGQMSDWTAIIANKLAIGKGPNIVINSDYDASDIPVPEGISSSSDIRLLR